MSDVIPTTYIHPRAAAAQLRVGDAERNTTCEELSLQYAAGRLTQFELEDRLSAAMAAQTRFDLNRLTVDLPAADRPAAVRPVPGPAPVAAAPRPGWSAIDVVALLALLGAVPLALLGAAFVITGLGTATIWVAVLTTVVAGTLGATATHLAHRSWARHEERIRSEARNTSEPR